MNDIQPTIDVAADVDVLASCAAERIVAAAEQSIDACRAFSLILAGGSTPRQLYQKLSTDPFRSRIDWSRIEFYFGDERCVPPDHADSNFRMANEAFFQPLAIKPASIHRMKGEIDPQQAAIEYGQMLKARFGDGGADMILLGMGDDGHTASLFPQTQALHETKHRCVANYVEKLSSWRITLTAPFLNRTRQVLILVAGSGKSSRVSEVLEGPRDPLRLPIQLIQPASGRLIWLMDAAAAGMEGEDGG